MPLSEVGSFLVFRMLCSSALSGRSGFYKWSTVVPWCLRGIGSKSPEDTGSADIQVLYIRQSLTALCIGRCRGPTTNDSNFMAFKIRIMRVILGAHCTYSKCNRPISSQSESPVLLLSLFLKGYCFHTSSLFISFKLHKHLLLRQ